MINGQVVLLLAVCGLAGCSRADHGELSSAAAVDKQASRDDTAPPQQAGSQPRPIAVPPATDSDTARGNIAPARAVGGGIYEAKLGELRISIRAPGCQPLMPSLLECRQGASVEVQVPPAGGMAAIRVEALDLNPLAAVYRGPLDGSYRKDGISIIVADVDLDGDEDVSVLTGRRGAYGSPSYTVFLRDQAGTAFVQSKPFSDLTVDHLGMFTMEAGKIRAFTKSGCCVHIDETYALDNDRPKLVEVVTRTSASAGAPEKVEVKRIIDGQLRVVQQ